MDPSRHHNFVGSNDERSRTTATNYYSREVPDMSSQHHYYGPAPGTAVPPPPPPATRNLNNSRKPSCDCTTTPSGANITCNGCRLNSPDDIWPPMGATSSTNSANEQQHQQQQQHPQRGPGDYRQIMVNEASMRSSIRQSPMYMQQQQVPPPLPLQQQHQQQHQHQPPPPQHMMQHGPPQSSQSLVQTHPSHVANRPNSYWPQNPSSTSSAQSYGDDHLAGPIPPGAQPTTQTQIDISITRRSAMPSGGSMDGAMYGQYKSASITATATHPSHASSSYPPPALSSSNHMLHQRSLNAIGGPPGPTSGAQAGSHYVTKERIYEQTKYSSTTTTTKFAYNSSTSSSAIYDSHHHHQMSSQAIMGGSKSSMPPIDHHVINPSNLPASKEQHPSPNYARKCPQMYTPEAEQSTAHHHHLYMPTPQFSSDKFTTRASPQQAPDYTKLRESPLQSSSTTTSVSPYMGDKYTNHITPPSHLRESPSQYVQQSSVSRNSTSSYYNSSQNHPSKVLPPEMSPIIMKQSPQAQYQYSTKSPLQPPPPLPPSINTHQMHHQVPPGAKANAIVLAPPGNPPPPPQRYIIENVKREDLEIYENSSRNSGGGIYLNPYNTPPPTGDACCKEVAPLSTSSSPYITGSATPNYRVESPQYYASKYGKLSMTSETPSKHSIIQQNTPPPSRAPSQRGHQQPAYYYEGNPHSAPSPAAATAASPSPSSLLMPTTTMSQTQMHHAAEYATPMQGVGGGGGPPPPGHSMSQLYPTQPSAQHQATTSSLRNTELIVATQNHNPYERVISHPHTTQQLQQHQSAPKHHSMQPSSALQMQSVSATGSSHHAAKLPAANAAATSKQQKPNYRELINRTLAMRSATSEEELNMQIIKKTLNVDTQGIRGPPGTAAPVSRVASATQSQSMGNNERLPMPVRDHVRSDNIPSQTVAKPSLASSSSSVLVTHNVASSLPRHETSRIAIKQEDDKPSSSSSSNAAAPLTTSSSPLDLSMRTVKTKADSTEYKYHHQQQQQQPRHLTPNSSSNEGRYTLPRVDSTPIFSVHAFEPSASAANDNSAAAATPLRQNSRHNSLDRRNYTPPTQPHVQSQSAGHTGPPNSYHSQSSSQYPTHRRAADTQHTASSVPPPHLKGCYETSCVIKTAPKPAPMAINSMAQARPSVLETNPYASVKKTEPKRIMEPIAAVAASSTQKALAAVERLPPDTSIMPLPPRNPCPVQRVGIGQPIAAPLQNNSSVPSMPPSYLQGCEKNPNFRKRHIQEYSNQMLVAGEPTTKQPRFLDVPPPVAVANKPLIPMRPADISVIAVNDVSHMEMERLNKAKQPLEVLVPHINAGSGVIASTAAVQPAKVIVNNHIQSLPSPTVVVVCKQEPLTPTGEVSPKTEIVTTPSVLQPVSTTSTQPPTNSVMQQQQVASSRIRTKAELKGFTFNPPPIQQQQQTENKPPVVAPAPFAIKQEELPTIKIKEEPDAKVDLPAIEGLEDDFSENKLLDFGCWSNTCNNFVEQLLTRPAKKKPLTNVITTKTFKDTSTAEMVVTSTDMMAVNKKTAVDNNFSNMESADNNTRSSFTRFDGAMESSMTVKSSMNQDSRNSPTSSLAPKKLTKLEREKKRFQQEKRLAERLQAKDFSSESEDELDKRKTERLKKPPMKAKNKCKTTKGSGNGHSSSTQVAETNHRFSDCGSDSSTETEAESTKSMPNLKKEMDEKAEEEKQPVIKASSKKMENVKKVKEEKEQKIETQEVAKKKESAITEKTLVKEEKIDKVPADKDREKSSSVKQETKKLFETSSSSSSETTEEDDKDEDNKDEDDNKDSKVFKTSAGDTKQINHSSKSKFTKVGLNTMTRSKRKKELELQLANSKVLRNDKVIRNSTTKIKRKYVRKYGNSGNSYLESGGLSRESGVMKSTRLKAKLERKGSNALALLKKDKKVGRPNKVDSGKISKHENEHDPNVLELYRFKRALKVPPSLINIKHPGSHKIAASLPDLERHAEALEAYAKKKKKSKGSDKLKTGIRTTKSLTRADLDDSLAHGEPRSIIDLLHSRVTKASGLNVNNKSTTTTAAKLAANKTCTSSISKAYSSNNCVIFSETSQTTESSELQMLPPLKQDSAEDEEEDDNDSANGGSAKKRHFSIFDTKVLPTKTRTESKMQQKRENIREIFVGDDRPASAPPEMTQAPENLGEKMTYEQKYEQFLQQMNIVISADKFGRFGRSAAARKLITPIGQPGSALNIKQEEGDTESTSVMDPDEPNEDQKSESHVNQLRKKRGKYLRRKGSSGFDYIRKKKKPTPASNVSGTPHNGSTNTTLNQFSIKAEKMELDEYEYKMKTEDDVSREIQKWVLNKGVGQSTMHKAARQGYIDVIVYCLDRMGMNPDQKDNAGYTPLHEACTNGWLEIARILLQYGANHSAAAHSGIRPLHEASENDHEEIVRLLLAYGADPLLATYSGQTPLMLASSTTMRDILNNHLVDVQSMMGPDRKPWKFNGPWEIYDPSECGYNLFEGAPNSICDMSRALLRKGSLTNNQMLQNKKLQQQQMLTNNTTTTTTATPVNTNQSTTAANNSTTHTILNQNSQNGPTATSSSGGNTGGVVSSSNNSTTNQQNSATSGGSSGSGGAIVAKGIDALMPQPKGETNTKTVMDECAVVLDKIDRFNAVRQNNDSSTKPEILVENSDSDGEMFEFEEADILLPPLYLLKDEGTNEKWVLLSDLCNLLKVKSKDTLLNKIYPSSSSSVASSTAHKSLMRELKMSDFLEKATCLQLLCAGEKINICASKVVLIKYNENVRNLLGVKTILMKF